MKFAVEILLDNAAFSIFDDENRKEIAEILRVVASQVECGPHWSFDLHWEGQAVGKTALIIERA